MAPIFHRACLLDSRGVMSAGSVMDLEERGSSSSPTTVLVYPDGLGFK